MSRNKYKKGDLLKCVKSASPGYKEGQKYRVETSDNMLGLKASDGFFDPLEMLVSSFEKVEEFVLKKPVAK